MENHIIRLVPVDFNDTQLGLCPVNTVRAFAIPSHLGNVAIESGAASVAGVKSEKRAILDDGAVFKVVGRLFRGGCEPWFMQVQGRVVELIDEEPIDKQFEARTNFERFAANVRWCIRPGRGLGETPMGQNQ
jgi:hypothetical protein